MTDRELIVNAAEKVLDWRVVPFDDRAQYRMPAYPAYFWRDNPGAVMIRTHPNQHAKDWNPLESITDAWMLVEVLRAKDWLITVKSMPRKFSFIVEGSRSEYDAPCHDRQIGQGKCSCEAHFMGEPWRHDEWALADSAPRAIVLACLRAIGVPA